MESKYHNTVLFLKFCDCFCSLMDKFITISMKQKVSNDIDFSNQGTAYVHGTPHSPNSTDSTAT
jgi:hypothetical protein